MPLTLKAPSRGVALAANERQWATVDVGGEQREIGIVAAIERQFNDLLGVDDLAVFARIGFENGGGAGDFDGLGDSADLQGEVDALAGINGDVAHRRWRLC